MTSLGVRRSEKLVNPARSLMSAVTTLSSPPSRRPRGSFIMISMISGAV
jgi:hypothetical protein